jgi:hypothetical protein
MELPHLASLPARSAARRLIFFVLWLAAIDLCVPAVLQRAEHRRYESRDVFRFENSDLFPVAPLVSYLRDNPRSDRRRVVFFGNSMVFGFGVHPDQSVPAMYEHLHPDARVFNMAINGQELGTGDLIGKAILGQVDRLYVQVIGKSAHPMMSSLLDVDEADARAYGLVLPSPLEKRLETLLTRVWRLWGARYRLQAAFFGTSTRQYLYLHKQEFVRRLLGRYRATPPNPLPEAPPDIRLRAPRAAVPPLPAELASRHEKPLLNLADRARASRKPTTFIEFEYRDHRSNDRHVAAFNAAYAPYAEIVIITLPREVTTDGQHLTAEGALGVARALTAHENRLATEAPR